MAVFCSPTVFIGPTAAKHAAAAAAEAAKAAQPPRALPTTAVVDGEEVAVPKHPMKWQGHDLCKLRAVGASALMQVSLRSYCCLVQTIVSPPRLWIDKCFEILVAIVPDLVRFERCAGADNGAAG
mgnify:CR=1 FL=1